MSTRRHVIAWLLTGVIMTLPYADGLATSASSRTGRLTVFISDLHLGVGKDPQTAHWHPFEDFRWGEEWGLFLHAIDEAGHGQADLIINGDLFELWQSVETDCRYPNRDLGCTETEALQRLQRVLAAHRPELGALGRFARAGNNQVVIVPGNHDAALLFTTVGAAAVAVIDAPGHVDLATNGFWRSNDGRLYAEHGHQIGREVNKWEAWPKPFVQRDGVTYLVRPWGEQFVQSYYNDVEARFPIIDNLSEEFDGIYYAVRARGWQTFPDVANLITFALLKVSPTQFSAALGERGHAPEWDVTAIRSTGPRFLLESLPHEDPLAPAADQALRDGSLEGVFASLTDHDLQAICDGRAAQRQAQKDEGRAISSTECPRKDGALGAAAQFAARIPEARILTNHLNAVCDRLPGCNAQAFDVFVYSHTHTPRQSFFPLQGEWKPSVVNTGAWQRVVTPEALEGIKKQGGLSADASVLPALQPEQLPPCYSFIMVRPYGDQSRPVPQLRYWRKIGETWSISAQCGS